MTITHKEVIKFVPIIRKTNLDSLFKKNIEINNQIEGMLEHCDQNDEMLVSEQLIEKLNTSIKEMKLYAKNMVSFTTMKYLERFDQV